MMNAHDYMNGAFNFTYITLQINKTGDTEIDEKLELFKKETLALLKKIQEKHEAYSNVPNTPDPSEIGIEYDFQENEKSTAIRCYIDYNRIIRAMYDISIKIDMNDYINDMIEKGIIDRDEVQKEGEYFKITNPNALKISKKFTLNHQIEIFCDLTGENFDEVSDKLNNSDDKEFQGEFINTVNSRYIFEYLKKLGYTLSSKPTAEWNIDFGNFLLIAALEFASSIGVSNTDAIVAKMCMFDSGKICIFGRRDENDKDTNIKTEKTVGKDFLLENSDTVWYSNMKTISIYSYEGDGGEVSVDLGCITLYANFPKAVKLEFVTRALDKIGDIYRRNCEIAAEKGIDAEDLDPEYCPHIVLDLKMRALDTITLVSGDMELLEIPFTPQGSDTEILLTRY